MLLMKSRFVNKTIKKYYARPFNQNSDLEDNDNHKLLCRYFPYYEKSPN